MPNLLLSDADDLLEWEDFIHFLDLCEQSALPRISLVEARGVRHPALPELIEYAALRNFDVRITTGGALEPEHGARLARVIERHPRLDGIRFLVPLAAAPPTGLLEIAGARAMLAGRLEDVDQGLELISRYRLEKRFELSFEAAREIEPFRRFAEQLDALLPKFRSAGVTPAFASGFPTCAFTDAQLGALTKLGTPLNPYGDPIIEVGPGLALWPNLHVRELKGLSLYDFQRLSQVVDRFHETVSTHRLRAGILSECEPCDIRARELCQGGSLIHQLSEVRLEQVHSGTSRRHLPLV